MRLKLLKETIHRRSSTHGKIEFEKGYNVDCKFEVDLIEVSIIEQAAGSRVRVAVDSSLREDEVVCGAGSVKFRKLAY